MGSPISLLQKNTTVHIVTQHIYRKHNFNLMVTETVLPSNFMSQTPIRIHTLTIWQNSSSRVWECPVSQYSQCCQSTLFSQHTKTHGNQQCHLAHGRILVQEFGSAHYHSTVSALNPPSFPHTLKHMVTSSVTQHIVEFQFKSLGVPSIIVQSVPSIHPLFPTNLTHGNQQCEFISTPPAIQHRHLHCFLSPLHIST